MNQQRDKVITKLKDSAIKSLNILQEKMDWFATYQEKKQHALSILNYNVKQAAASVRSKHSIEMASKKSIMKKTVASLMKQHKAEMTGNQSQNYKVR